MKSVKITRKKTGMTQQQLAEWLGVSRSLITLAEQGRRDLPTNALLKLDTLSLLDRNTENPATTTPPDPALKKILRKRLLNCRYKLAKANRQLEALRLIREQNIQLQKTNNLLAQTQAGNGPKEKLWLQVQQDKAGLTNKSVSATRLSLLDLEITLLQYEEKEIVRRIAVL